MSQKRRVIISDVTKDIEFARHVSIAKANGFRAVQSTPFFHNGNFLGVLSTHFPDVHQLSANASATLDECASDIVALLDSGIESL